LLRWWVLLLPQLEKRFKHLIEKGRSEGKKSLRRAQFEKPIQGDVRMQMWLGRQWLNQQDQPTDEANTAPLGRSWDISTKNKENYWYCSMVMF
jgi:hypothetical protein